MPRQHFVQFFSPGTLVSETSTLPIDKRDTHLAADMARTITERHGAKPYGFQFITKIVAEPVPDGEGGTLDVTPKEVERSGTHYITGELTLYDEVPLCEDTLRSNMRRNRHPIYIENNNSYRFTISFEESDCIVDAEGRIIRYGNDADLVEYRAKKLAEWIAG